MGSDQVYRACRRGLRVERFRRADHRHDRGLCRVAIEIGGLLPPVQKEPQLNAGVGDRYPHVHLLGVADRCVDIGVLVDVEHTPHRVVPAAVTLLGVTRRACLRIGGEPDQCDWCPMVGADLEIEMVTKGAPPSHQVGGLGLSPFGEHQHAAAHRRTARGSSEGPPASSGHARASSTMSANS